MDLVKYRALFLEEAAEHLAEMSRSLLLLEKDPADGEALGVVFRMAHSIKGMAGSLGYDAVTELAHALEDRVEGCRAAGRVEPGGGIGLLFEGLEGLERMVAAVRESGEPPAPQPDLVARLGQAANGAAAAEGRPKKA